MTEYSVTRKKSVPVIIIKRSIQAGGGKGNRCHFKHNRNLHLKFYYNIDRNYKAIILQLPEML